MTEEEIRAAVAKERASMTPEQWENQRQAAIDIMGPDPIFDKMRAEEEEANVKKGMKYK
jgi:hypothetical protein